MTNKPTAQKIAEYFIWFFHEHGDIITNLKLQKLLYYAQGWYLAIHNKSLFDETFEAWIHGPVIPSVYHQFKNSSYEPILGDYIKPTLPLSIQKFLEEIIEVYGGYTAFELENLTHQTDPWIKARNNIPLDEPSNAKIAESSIQVYFQRKMAENEKQA